MNNSESTVSIMNVLLVISLIATLVFVILSCFLPYVVFPWLSLGFGVVTLVLGLVKYFEW